MAEDQDSAQKDGRRSEYVDVLMGTMNDTRRSEVNWGGGGEAQHYTMAQWLAKCRIMMAANFLYPASR